MTIFSPMTLEVADDLMRQTNAIYAQTGEGASYMDILSIVCMTRGYKVIDVINVYKKEYDLDKMLNL